MKRTLAIILVLLFSISMLAGCSNGGSGDGDKVATLTGKYTIVSWEVDGQDWLEFFEMMSEMADEGDEFNRDDIYIDFQSGGKFTMAMIDEGEETTEGTFTVGGNTVTLTVDGEDLKGTIDGKKIIIEEEEDGVSMKMVFEKK